MSTQPLRITSIFASCLPVVACVVVFASCGAMQAQTLLRYRYTPGDVQQYELKQTLNTSSVIDGQTYENVMSQQLQLATRVDQTHDDGSADVTKRIVRVQMQATQPGQDQPLTYDSAAPGELSGPMGMIAKTMTSMVNQNIQMVIDSQGNASQVKLPAAMEQRFLSQPGGIAGLNSPEGVKKMISQGSMIFPRQAVNVNDRWNRTLSTELPFATMNSTITLTYAGRTKKGLHRIDATSKIELKPKDGTPFQVTMKQADGRGVYMFDAERGCIYASALKQTMNLEMTAVGQTVQQNVVTDITMRLLEPAVTRTATRP